MGCHSHGKLHIKSEPHKKKGGGETSLYTKKKYLHGTGHVPIYTNVDWINIILTQFTRHIPWGWNLHVFGLESTTCLKFGPYLGCTQIEAHHMHLKTLHYEDYSPNSQKLSLVDAFTIATIHEFITSLSSLHKMCYYKTWC